MPETTFSLLFVLRQPRGSIPYEEQQYTNLDDAWAAFRTFAEPDSCELYSRIELVRTDWNATDFSPILIAAMDFEQQLLNQDRL